MNESVFMNPNANNMIIHVTPAVTAMAPTRFTKLGRFFARYTMMITGNTIASKSPISSTGCDIVE